jgi:demethylmenaquinone methyltransferase / 2-methoxy-6-polyprenyl-1,4-benzoquinol methylase
MASIGYSVRGVTVAMLKAQGRPTLGFRAATLTAVTTSHRNTTPLSCMPVDKSESRVRQTFGFDKYWRWQTVRSVAPLNDSPMLDLCTGTGDLALAYAKHLPTGGKIVGADFCHEMLAIGRQKAARAGRNGQMAFIEADAQHLPFSDNQFQIVCVAFGLRNITDTDRGLREMVRVCQPGGRVAVLEFSMPQRQPVRGIYTFFFRRVLPKIGQAVSQSQSNAYNYLPQSVLEFPEGEALCQRMRAAGLREVRYRSLTLGTVTLYVGIK